MSRFHQAPRCGPSCWFRDHPLNSKAEGHGKGGLEFNLITVGNRRESDKFYACFIKMALEGENG